MDPRIIIAAAVLIAVSLFDYYVWSGLMHSSIPGSVVAFAILAIISVGMTVFAIAVVGERVESPEVHACGHSHVGCHLVYVVLLYILAPHAIWRLFAVQHK